MPEDFYNPAFGSLSFDDDVVDVEQVREKAMEDIKNDEPEVKKLTKANARAKRLALSKEKNKKLRETVRSRLATLRPRAVRVLDAGKKSDKKKKVVKKLTRTQKKKAEEKKRRVRAVALDAGKKASKRKRAPEKADSKSTEQAISAREKRAEGRKRKREQDEQEEEKEEWYGTLNTPRHKKQKEKTKEPTKKKSKKKTKDVFSDVLT